MPVEPTMSAVRALAEEVDRLDGDVVSVPVSIPLGMYGKLGTIQAAGIQGQSVGAMDCLFP
jgi:hypothetical protein